MAHDERRDSPDPDRPDRDADPSACRPPSGAARRRVDREQRRHRLLLTWSRSIDCDLARFRLAIARDRARRERDVTGLARLDQLVAALRDEGRRDRSRLRILRGRLRRAGSGGGPGRPLFKGGC